MTHPAVYYKALRLGDTVRSHPAPQVSIEGVDFAPTWAGNSAVVGEKGAAGRTSIEIEPLLIRTFDRSTGDVGASETDAAFFERKLEFANNLRSYAGHKPTDATTRLGPVVWIDAPVGADKFAVSSYSAADPDPKSTANLTGTVGTTIAVGEKFLLVSGDEYSIVTVTDIANPSDTTIKFTPVAAADFVAASAMLRIRWMLDGAALSGDYRGGEGDRVARVARGSTLRFDSVSDFWVRP